MNNRILRINEDIQHELATLLRNIKDPRIASQGMISITSVETSGDLGQAKVYLSVMKTAPSKAEHQVESLSQAEASPAQARKELLRGLKSASGYLRFELGRVLSLRHTPELKFILDESIEKGARINELLRKNSVAADSSSGSPETGNSK